MMMAMMAMPKTINDESDDDESDDDLEGGGSGKMNGCISSKDMIYVVCAAMKCTKRQ